jgi:hypothetical protein
VAFPENIICKLATLTLIKDEGLGTHHHQQHFVNFGFILKLRMLGSLGL